MLKYIIDTYVQHHTRGYQLFILNKKGTDCLKYKDKIPKEKHMELRT